MGTGEFPLFAYVQKGVFSLCPEGFMNCLRRGETVSCHSSTPIVKEDEERDMREGNLLQSAMNI